MEENLLQIGVITSTHGIKGEVKVFPTTDDNNRFKKLKECYIEYEGKMLPVKADGCRFFKNMIILRFEGIENINDVEKYKKCKLFVDREHAVRLEQDEYFMADLIGAEVVREDGSLLGRLTEIISTGANDVYVVSGDAGEEWLLPAIKDCILDVDIKVGRLTVRLMKGMEE
ncbi:MAG: ribosome maturation factor RimM [Lachnospiraceae bacterium]|nr:ribosome maturation factor RimM [Lachnospiraceae bacterium]MDE6624790.1 ribosome maturation factor RimM [Lachnospiraceae bacterium]